MSKVYENDEIREGTTEETRAVKTNLGGVEPPLDRAKQSDSVFSNKSQVTDWANAQAQENGQGTHNVFEFDASNLQDKTLTIEAKINPTVKPEAAIKTGLVLIGTNSSQSWAATIGRVKEFPYTFTIPSHCTGIRAITLLEKGATLSGYNETFDCDVELYQNTKNIVLEER